MEVRLNKVGHFEKVSYEQFSNDLKSEFPTKWSDDEIRRFYDNIKLPRRATKGSAGYDFFCPIPLEFREWWEIKFPTGIRVSIEPGWFLECHPRSGLGFKYALRLFNNCGIIDSDYFSSSNEGHIWAKMRVEKENVRLPVKPGDAFMQGIFTIHGITDDDDADGVRDGGFGSTSR